MDIQKAILFLEGFNERKSALNNREEILDYSINLLKISYDIFDYLITLKFGNLSETLESLSFEEAIIKANIIRINHFIHSVIILSENNSINVETIQVLNRVHFESCVNLLYITKEKELIKTRISSYTKRSLKDLKEMLDKELRPNELDKNEDLKNPKIANRIENSISEVLNRIGVSEKEITNNSSWGSFKSRYSDIISSKNFYNLLYSTGSSSIHGNFDLVFKYYTNGNYKTGFSLLTNPKRNDFRLISGYNFNNLILITHLVKMFFLDDEQIKLKDLIIILNQINTELVILDEELLP
jgi:hypothetical protein